MEAPLGLVVETVVGGTVLSMAVFRLYYTIWLCKDYTTLVVETDSSGIYDIFYSTCLHLYSPIESLINRYYNYTTIKSELQQKVMAFLNIFGLTQRGLIIWFCSFLDTKVFLENLGAFL